MFQQYTDRQFMDALRAGGIARENVWRYIAVHWSGYCCGTVIKKTGCKEDEAKEAFSIACLGVDKRAQSADFQITASLKTYLTSATIYAAWALMRRRIKDAGEAGIRQYAGDGEEDVNKWFRQKECRDMLEQALANIGERCKKILILFKDGFGMKEIMEEMGFGTEDVAKAQKWQCQEKFRGYLRENPNIKNLLKENCYG